VGRVVGEVGRDPGEEVLVGLAGHEIAVVERGHAELGQQGVARPVDVDPDAALVLELVANLLAAQDGVPRRGVPRRGAVRGRSFRAIIHSRRRLAQVLLALENRRPVHTLLPRYSHLWIG
jgi:hypothetical protein